MPLGHVNLSNKVSVINIRILYFIVNKKPPSVLGGCNDVRRVPGYLH